MVELMLTVARWAMDWWFVGAIIACFIYAYYMSRKFDNGDFNERN